MKKLLTPLAVAAVALASFSSCSKDDVKVKDQVSEETMNQIRAMGFTATGAQKVDGGYLVEGDILLSEAELQNPQAPQLLRTGNAEQYRTTNLVNAGSGREITVSISSQLPSTYVAGLDEAIARYNAQGLLLSFRRVSSGADIAIVRGNGQYLASAGFPASGNPYNQVKVNSNAIGSSPNTNYLATILAHEIGHCIGFRHTDYMDRSYSCGGATANEGASTVGAILIPGTPTTADPGSFMLACIGSGQNRYFNNNDITALNYLY
ncbi:M57 family metalloprotease [Solirubrum puertoriconensis]|uniref:Protease n=1 Tax=Solirubrum puertoriconensis TaxID=1751427 RepID=A0A9X0HIR8_SOLP1|nr:M57 family metalloprotease [Solirubrum puertoriconensis]KUG06609.1 protease [Solirubrum puertoriconensis]